MPKRSQATLSGLVDVSSDEETHLVETDAVPTADYAVENMMPTRKGRGRLKATSTKVTKQKAPARRASSGKQNAARGNKRKVFADRTNQQEDVPDTESMEELEKTDDTMVDEGASADELDASMVASTKKNSRAKKSTGSRSGKKKASASHHKQQSENEDDEIEEQENKTSKSETQPKYRPTVSSQSNEEVQEIQETRVAPLDVDVAEDIEESVLGPIICRTNLARSVSQSRQPSVVKKRAGSVSDVERSDPAIRRKLGDMTKKFENLDLKYRTLLEIGVKEAEHNFERLKKQHEESSKAAAVLISSLKAELADKSNDAKEAQILKQRLQSQDGEIQKLREKITEFTSSLSEAQVENKTLSMKLSANRTAASTVESANTRTPGHALAINGGIRMMGSAEAAQAAQTAQLKEDLYSDLTGLIIRGVKKEADEDVYDCIQTGRNGTLHFKLAVTNEKSAENFEDAQGTYIPQLDPSRDKMLMDVLPDYLVEEIYFPRPQAAKFYARVFKALTEKTS